MGLYSRFVLPRIVHGVCSMKNATQQREKLVPLASGSVLEVGVGSGLNLPFYDPAKVKHVWALDPSPVMVKMAHRVAKSVAIPVDFFTLPCEELPLARHSVDTVVTTYTLCSVPDVVGALRRMARVLKPGGTLLFCEHTVSPDASVRRWQERLNPLWKRFAGGCHLNRDVLALLQEGGFRIQSSETAYVSGAR
ncbi:MAG: class I SAM-dependent methyltransferase, partial [bacterium]|nr:class I SAM-dependent methyltransferase [bacterium]